MRYLTLCISGYISLCLLSGNIVMAKENDLPIVAWVQSYADYQKIYGLSCDAPEKSWNMLDGSPDTPLYSLPTYVEIDTAAIKADIASLASDDCMKDQNITIDTIQGFPGLKTVEIARKKYRCAMDRIFGCGIVSSRLIISRDLLRKVKLKFPSANSEIQKKIDQEVKKLEAQYSKLSCRENSAQGWEQESRDTVTRRIINSSTKQYCHFVTYLSYLDSNMNKGNANLMNIESAVTLGAPVKIDTNSAGWLRDITFRQSQIQREIARARYTLPRAMDAYRESSKTYGVHIMLLIIYDDYLKVRENLSTYMNAFSQLYEKLNNAQNANKQ
jgi:hypothetical protein